MQQLPENSQELSLFNLTIEGFWQLQSSGIDLNHLFILECLNEGTDIEKHTNIAKVKAWKQNLYRKSLITEAGEVTTLGKELLTSLALPNSSSPREIIKKAISSADDAFDQWWKAYPSTDMFSYGGIRFDGARGLRQKKEDCRKKFGEILLEGEYSAEDLIRALEYEIFMKKENSVKQKENKMKYMQNSLTYLNQRTFENFVELARDYVKVVSDQRPSSSTVDI